jgi:hypothetical protein
MTYLIEAPHSPDECVQAMDEALAKGPRCLAQFDWGCVEDRHTGWATVQAGSESEARNMVPSIVRSKARVTRVGKVTPDQVNAMLSIPPEEEGPADTPESFEAVLAGPVEESHEDMWAASETWMTP